MKDQTELEKGRTLRQNKALHVYFELLAQELNDAGLDMRVVLKPEVNIPWDKQTVKEYLWSPIQKAMKLSDSTTKLTTKEVNEVYAVLDRHLSETRGIHVEFPHDSLPGMDLLK